MSRPSAKKKSKGCVTIRVSSRSVRRVCEELEAEYGRPSLGNPSDPIDDLVYIILSNKTSPKTAVKTYEELKSRFRDWDSMLGASIREVRRIIRPAGLAAVKSSQLRAALRRVKEDWGLRGMRQMAELPAEDAEAYLVSLPGVSHKVAKCVLMYTMGAAVLPVDSHVHRIATRLGWTARGRPDQCHKELESLVPPHRRHAFHVDCIAHGRLICRPSKPLCCRCCIRRCCRFVREAARRDRKT
jgi:endonuclease III